MVSDAEAGPPVPPELRWAKVTGPDAFEPLDRHWIRYVRIAFLLAAVLIAWRILAWQEDGYREAAAAAGSGVVLQPLPTSMPAQTAPPTSEPAQAGVPIVVLSPTPTATPTPVPTPTPTPAPTPLTHEVRPGQTLSGIADLYDVPINVIEQLNNIPDRNNLVVGQLLRLPEGTVIPEQAEAPGPYIVKPGDTLSIIAIDYGVTIADLMAFNGISDPNSIFAGQELRIPPGRPG